MVATERRMRAETEDELKKLALHSTLRLIDGENTTPWGRPNLSSSEEKQIADIIVFFLSATFTFFITNGGEILSCIPRFVFYTPTITAIT